MPGRGRALPAPVFVDLMDRARIRRLCLVAVAVTAALVYANAVQNGFVLDDGGILLSNPLVVSPATSWRAFGLPYWPESLGGGQYRPLGIVSFALDWFLSGGNPHWFHLVNLLWHVAATVAVWFLAAELLAPVAAWAQTAWTGAPGAGVIDEQSVGIYQADPGGIYHNASGSTATIFARYNLTDTTGFGTPGWTTIELGAYDPSPSSQVMIKVFRVNLLGSTSMISACGSLDAGFISKRLSFS